MAIKSESIASVIVTDFSWALINSVMHQMNRCNIVNYLNWSFEIIYKNNIDFTFLRIMRTKLFICCTHMLRNIVKSSELLEKDAKVAKCFKFSFALLQNTTECSDFDYRLKLIYIVFNSPSKTPFFSDAFNKLSDQLKQQVASNDVEAELNFSKLCIKTQEQAYSSVYLDPNTIGSIKASSPFQAYFNNMLNAMKFEKNKSRNEYYNPRLFLLIRTKLYLAPLWSGLLIKHINVKTPVRRTRFTNNPVENYFGQLKNNIINKKTKLTTSELACDIFDRLESKYILSYQSSSSGGLISKKSDDLINSSETWKKGKLGPRQKGLYYGAADIGKQDTTDLETSEVKKLELTLTNQDNFSLITTTFMNNKHMFENLVKLFRSKTRIFYSSQKLDNRFSTILKLNNLVEFFPLHASSDGNCFYNSISLNFFGNQSMAGLVKLGAVFIFLENETLFQLILRRLDYEESFQQLVIKILRHSEWANELVILATSILFNRDLFTLGQTSSHSHLTFAMRYSLIDRSPSISDKFQPILIGWFEDHFVPFVPSRSANLVAAEIENANEQYNRFRNHYNFKNYD